MTIDIEKLKKKKTKSGKVQITVTLEKQTIDVLLKQDINVQKLIKALVAALS